MIRPSLLVRKGKATTAGRTDVTRARAFVHALSLSLFIKGGASLVLQNKV